MYASVWYDSRTTVLLETAGGDKRELIRSRWPMNMLLLSKRPIAIGCILSECQDVELDLIEKFTARAVKYWSRSCILSQRYTHRTANNFGLFQSSMNFQIKNYLYYCSLSSNWNNHSKWVVLPFYRFSHVLIYAYSVLLSNKRERSR
jgi:hypothetical protein